MFEIASMSIFVEPRHNVDPASHAYCGRIVMVVEGHAIRLQIVDVRSLNFLVTVAAKRVTGLVIGEKKNNVGSTFGLHF